MLYSGSQGHAEDNDITFKNHIRQVKELYGWHFPELGILVKDDLTFVKVVKLMGKYNDYIQ